MPGPGAGPRPGGWEILVYDLSLSPVSGELMSCKRQTCSLFIVSVHLHENPFSVLLVLYNFATWNSIIPQAALRQFHNSFHCEFSTECDLVFPLSIASIFFSLKVIQYLLTSFSLSSRHFHYSLYFPSIPCFRRQFLRNMWPIQLAFLLFTVCRIFVSS